MVPGDMEGVMRPLAKATPRRDSNMKQRHAEGAVFHKASYIIFELMSTGVRVEYYFPVASDGSLISCVSCAY